VTDGFTAPGALAPLKHEDAEFQLHRRFDRMGRLVGDDAMRALFDAHAMVVGQGGVGSWAAEALVRAGFGQVTVVDFDLVCVTNGNRQLHAVRGTTGRPKAEVMAERLRTINPSAEIRARTEFYEKTTSEELFALAPTVVVDAIDNLTTKADLIAQCRARAIPVIVSGGASGRLDPTAIRTSDLALVRGDPFLSRTRKLLRKHHGLPTEGPWGICAVHSLESPAMPHELAYERDTGFRCVCPQGQNGKHTCDQRNVIYGTAGFVTGAFGLACAAAATRAVLQPA
jgi:tRNA A37 threonylcarbamoyladenosine dehydratase